MKNMKNILSVIGLLTIAIPTSLSVVACGPIKTNPEIEEITSEKFIEILNNRSENDPIEFNILIGSEANNETFTNMAEQIHDEFLNKYNYKVNMSKLDIENIYIHSDKMNPNSISYKWFKEVQIIEANLAHISYDGVEIDSINIIINVVENN